MINEEENQKIENYLNDPQKNGLWKGEFHLNNQMMQSIYTEDNEYIAFLKRIPSKRYFNTSIFDQPDILKHPDIIIVNIYNFLQDRDFENDVPRKVFNRYEQEEQDYKKTKQIVEQFKINAQEVVSVDGNIFYNSPIHNNNFIVLATNKKVINDLNEIFKQLNYAYLTKLHKSFSKNIILYAYFFIQIIFSIIYFTHLKKSNIFLKH